MRSIVQALLAALACLCVTAPAAAQTTYTWSTSGSASLWGTGGNWNLGTAPGSSSTTTNNDIGSFAAAGTSTTIQFNFGTIGQPYYLGTIQLLSTDTVARTFGSNSGTAGTLVLNGTGANSLILDNQSAVAMTVAPQAGGGTGPLSLQLTAANSTINAAGAITISAVIGESSGSAKAITKTGAGTLTLSGANTFTGGVTLAGGTLSFGAANNLGTGPLNVSAVGTTISVTGTAVTLSNTTNLTLPNLTGRVTFVTPNSSSTVINGTITGGAASTSTTAVTGTEWFFQGGASGSNTGALTLNGNNSSWQGTVNVQRGPLILGNANAAGSTLLWLDSNLPAAGVIQFAGSFTINNNVHIQSGASNAVGVDGALVAGIAGGINSNGALGINKVGTGTLVLSGANTYTGATTVTAGTLQVGGGGTTGTLGTGAVTNNATLAFNRSDAVTVSNVIGGTGAVNQTGSGSTTLSGANTFTGPVNVSAGTLVLGNTNATTAAATVTGGTLQVGTGGTLNSATATVGSGGTLQVGQGGTLTSTTVTISSGGLFDVSPQLGGYTFASGRTLVVGRTGTPATDVLGSVTVAGTLSVGASSSARTATFGNDLTLSGAGVNFDLNNVVTPGGGVNDLVRVLGNLTLSGTTTVNVTPLTGGALTSGSYTLFTYSGALTGGAANLSLAGGGGGTTRQAFTFDTTTTTGSVFLTVTGSPANLTWVGSGANNVWDLVTTANFTGAPGPTPDNRFYNLDTVTFTDAGVGGATAVTLTGTLAPAAVTVNATQDYTFGGTGSITGTAGLTKSGTGTLTILTNNTYTGGTTINAGTLQLGNGGTSGTITGDVTNNGTLVVNRSDALTLAGVISGTGAVRATGGGTLTLSGTNTYAGATTVTAGSTLSVAADANLGAAPGAATPGQLVLNNGTLAASAGFTLSANRGIAVGPTSGAGGGTVNIPTGTLSYDGVIANNGGTGSLTKTGAGTLALGGANTYTGGTTVTGGAVNFTNGAAFGTGAITFGAGVLNQAGTSASPGTAFLNNTTAANTTLANAIALPTPGAATTYTIQKTSSGGQLNFTGDISGGNANTKLFLNFGTGGDATSSYRFAGNNTFVATVELWRGAIIAASPTALGDPTNLIRLDSNNNTALGDLRFEVGGTFANPIESVTGGSGPINTNANNVTLSGVVSGGSTVGLTKLGTGTLTLTNANTYTGPTVVNAGTVLANNTTGSGTGTGAVTVNTGGTFGGSGTVSGAVATASGGTLRGGDPASATNNTLTIGSGLTVAANSTVGVRLLTLTPDVAGANPASNSFLNITGGTTTISAGANFLIDGTGQSFNTSTTYQYRIAAGAGDQSLLHIDSTNSPGQFSTVNFASAASFAFTISGDSLGGVYLTLAPAPVPEPGMVLGLAAGMLALRRVRRKAA